MQEHTSWGRLPQATQEIFYPRWSSNGLLPSNARSMLAFGKGRSYGDSCLNDGGTLLDTRGLNHFISWNSESGALCCEAGVTLDEILRLFVPRGWFLPVTPGTKFVTVGGAIANDVHGKNHHRAGTFGCHVSELELLRSTGERLVCSPAQNADLFRATIGGLGLTGLITKATINLKRISTSFIDSETIRYENLDEFFQLSADSERSHDFVVSWADCLSGPPKLGRGLFMRGNFSADASLGLATHPQRTIPFPFEAPGWLLNRGSVQAFNTLYFHKQRKRIVSSAVHYNPFFYPLDAIDRWNRLYGRRGFYQYQFLVPHAEGEPGIRDCLLRISKSGMASFLTVLKTFGSRVSPGILSFPRCGTTLALDFANKGEVTRRLMDDLDAIVLEHRGRVYPAKDAHMSPTSFRAFYPEWEEFAEFVDPCFSSSFWRRVTAR